MKKTKLRVCVLGLLLVGVCGANVARADLAYVNYVIGDGGLETFNITWDGTIENGLAGGIALSQQYSVGPNHQAGMPQTYTTVCTDIGGTLYLGYLYGYSEPQVFSGLAGVRPTWGAANQAGLANPQNAVAAIQAAADLFYHHSGVLTTGTVSDKAALQLAVWEALYDTTAGSTAYDLSGGRFSVNSGDQTAINEATLWVSQVNVNARYAGFLLVPDPVQQYGLPGQEVLYNVSGVPETTTLLAGALLLLPFGARTLRSRRQR